jgi:hypothetical protein
MTTLKLRGDVGKLLWSHTSPDAGDPTCLCSACGSWISEDCLPVRLFDERKNVEARFCDPCAATWLGLHTFPDERDDYREYDP